ARARTAATRTRKELDMTLSGPRPGDRWGRPLSLILGSLALPLLAAVPGRSAFTGTATITAASAAASTLLSDPCIAAPDRLDADGQFVISQNASVTWEW